MLRLRAARPRDARKLRREMSRMVPLLCSAVLSRGSLVSAPFEKVWKFSSVEGRAFKGRAKEDVNGLRLEGPAKEKAPLTGRGPFNGGLKKERLFESCLAAGDDRRKLAKRIYVLCAMSAPPGRGAGPCRVAPLDL